MSKNENHSQKVTTPEFRLSFPKFEKAEQIMDQGPNYFSCQLLFDKKGDNSWIQNILKDLYKKKWGDVKKPSTFKSPWRDGDEKAAESDIECYVGTMFMNAKAGEKDKILFIDGKKNVIDQSAFYAGCYCKAVIEFRTFDNKYGKGISAWLKGIQFVKDGESLGGGSTASSDDFEVIEGAKAVNEISDEDF